MIITSTVGKIDAAIGRFEGPLLAYMEKEEGDFAKQSLKKTLYNVKTSKHYSESVAGLTGIGDLVQTDGEIPYDSFEEGFSKTFIHKVFKKGIQIKRETIDDAKLIDMQSQAGNLIDSYNRTVEKFVHAPFNFIDQATFSLAGGTFDNKGADGQPLASHSHPSKTGKAVNQDNLTSFAFNAANLKLVEEMFNNFTTDIGEKANVFPDTIIVPFELRNEAWELVGSEGATGTNNNNINSFYGKYNVIVSRWLTDKKAWFLVDSNYMKKCLYWLDRVPFETKSQVDFNTDNWMIKAYCRFSLGFTDWRWIIANKPAA